MEMLGRQLYLAYRAMRDHLDEALRAVDASVPQWIVLRSAGDEPELSQRELADRILVTGSTLTHHLDRLEADGLIARSRDLQDRRIIRISLTAAGKDRRTELEGIVTAHDRRLQALLTPGDAAELGRLLGRVRRGMDES